MIVAAVGAAIWTIPPAVGYTNLGLVLFAAYVLPLAFFGTGAGWIAVHRHGVGVTIFVMRGAVVFVMLFLWLVVALAPPSRATVVWFLVFLAICLASSAVSAVALGRSELRARRNAPPSAAREPALRISPGEPVFVQAPSSTADRWRAALVLATIVTGATLLPLLLLAYGRGTQVPLPRDTDVRVDAIARFRTFPVYWVGRSYDGHQLDRVIGQYPGEESDPVLFLYGTCGRAFEAGCVPWLVVKTQQGCLGDVDAGLKVRERTAHQASHLSVQAGDVVVTLYAATHQLEVNAARDMFTANANAASNIPAVIAGGPLPGSLCELARLHPAAFPTPWPGRPVSTRESLPATVLSSFGRIGIPRSLDEAQRQLGWRVLRTNDPRFTLSLVGAIRTFRNTLPRLEQTKYTMVGHSYPIDIAQEPESYPTFDVAPYSSIETIGAWTGRLWTYSAQVGFDFYSGETVEGQRVRVSVYGERGAVTLEDIRAFVSTLGFAD